MLLLALLLCPGAHAAPLTLADALAEAMAHNLELRRAGIEVEQAEAGLLGARAAYDPTLGLAVGTAASRSPSNSVLDGSASVDSRSFGWSAAVDQLLPTGGTVGLSWQESTSTTDSESTVLDQSTSAGVALTVRQPLLDGMGPLSTNAEIRDARRTVEEARLGRRDRAERVAGAVSAAYWGLVAAREQAELARRSLEIAEQELSDTRERQAEGFAGSGDVLQVERAVGVARQAVVVGEAQVAAAEAELTAVLGRPLVGRAPIEPVDRPVIPKVDPAFEEVLAQARAGNAAWRRAGIARESAQDRARQARQEALPDLTLSGSVGFDGLAEDARGARTGVSEGSYRSWALGADLSLPLPGRATAATLRGARATDRAAALDLESAEQDLVLSAEEASRNLARDRARESLARETVEAARLALAADQELLEEGRGSTRDVILSLEALDEAQVDRLQAEIDLQASLLELARVEGRLLGLLGLEGQGPNAGLRD